MGSLLHKLWDETLAGPTPDSGLGKLRKNTSLSARSAADPPPDLVSPPRDDVSGKIGDPRRSIRRNLTVSVDSTPAPPSPSGPSTPSSPFTPTTPGGNYRKLSRRKSASAALPSESKSPTGYDWIVLSALDR